MHCDSCGRHERLYSFGVSRAFKDMQRAARLIANSKITEIPMSPELTSIVESFKKRKQGEAC